MIGDVANVEAHWAQLIQPAVCPNFLSSASQVKC